MSYLAVGAAAVTVGTGIFQAATSGKNKRARELEQFAKTSPLYKGSKSIDDYYQQALNRYSENPYQSQQYQLGAMNAQRATAQGIGALQDRRSAIGGISRLALGQTSAMQNLGAQAEAQRNQRFGQLGGAAQMKTAEDYKKFDINQMTPFNRMLQLKQYRAQAAADQYNAGMQSIASGASNIAMTGVSKGGFGAKSPVPSSGGNISPENILSNSKMVGDFNATRGSLDLSGMGLKPSSLEPSFGPNSGNLYGYRGGNFLKTTNKKL
jgi:hypothetical protein